MRKRKGTILDLVKTIITNLPLDQEITVDLIYNLAKKYTSDINKLYIRNILNKLVKEGVLIKDRKKVWKKKEQFRYEEVKVGKQYLYIIYFGSNNPLLVRSDTRLTEPEQVLSKITYQSVTDVLYSFNYIGMMKLQEKLDNIEDKYLRKAIPTFIFEHKLAILPNGNILGYKYICIKEDKMVSCFDRSTVHEFHKVVEVDQVDHDHNKTCSKGLHVAGIEYLEYTPTGAKIIAVEIDPLDIASIPYGNEGKMRVKRYIPRFTISETPDLDKKKFIHKLVLYIQQELIKAEE